MHNDERKTIFEQLTGARAESNEEHYGNDGDVRAMLERAIAQKKLDEQMLRNRAPETD